MKVWDGGFRRAGERDEEEHAVVWGARAPWSVLTGLPALAVALWAPLLAHENVTEQ